MRRTSRKRLWPPKPAGRWVAARVASGRVGCRVGPRRVGSDGSSWDDSAFVTHSEHGARAPREALKWRDLRHRRPCHKGSRRTFCANYFCCCCPCSCSPSAPPLSCALRLPSKPPGPPAPPRPSAPAPRSPPTRGPEMREGCCRKGSGILECVRMSRKGLWPPKPVGRNQKSLVLEARRLVGSGRVGHNKITSNHKQATVQATTRKHQGTTATTAKPRARQSNCKRTHARTHKLSTTIHCKQP